MARRTRVRASIRFEPALYEALNAAADRVGVSLTWLVTKFCEEGLALGRQEYCRGWRDAMAQEHPPEAARSYSEGSGVPQ